MSFFKWIKELFEQPPAQLQHIKFFVDSSLGYEKQDNDGWDALDLSRSYKMGKRGDCDDFARYYRDTACRLFGIKDVYFYLFYSNGESHVVTVVDKKWVLDNQRKYVYKLKDLKKEKAVEYNLIPFYIQQYCLKDI